MPIDPARGSKAFADLSTDDQAELRLFKEKMDEYDAAVQQCTQEKQAAQAEANQLAKEIKDEEANLQADVKGLKKDRKALTPEELQQRKDELQKLEKDIKEKKAKKSSLEKKAKLKCKVAPPGFCVPATDSSKIAAPLGDIPKLVNDANHSKIDFSRLLTQEGAHYAAYVPWKPLAAGEKKYTTTTNYPSIDDPTQIGASVVKGGPKYGTHSGVTIGMGIDLGDQDKVQYYKDMDAVNDKYKILSQDELNNLEQKIDPYMGKKRARACQYLRDHPLELNDNELKLLHLRAIQVALNAAKGDSEFQSNQTGIFLRAYRGGS